MKRLTFVIIILIIGSYNKINAQTSPPPYYGAIKYQYDARGNRIQRDIVVNLIASRHLPDSTNRKDTLVSKRDSLQQSTDLRELETEMHKVMQYGISASPNPVQSVVTITVNALKEGQSAEIMLLDNLGRQLSSQLMEGFLAKVDLSSHNSGIYYLKIRLIKPEDIIIYKLVKLE
ncbi:MAG: T9SS type A sorting domain-containing protein [Bacteroidota bacterium]